MRSLGVFLLMTFVFVAAADAEDGLRDWLVFHASFDKSVDADSARGDGRLYTAETLQRNKVQAGLHSPAVRHDTSGGRFGGALVFSKKVPQLTFYKGGDNLPYTAKDWQGTISFWLQLDPARDLPPGYVDPLQITDKKWNDASFFVDFTKENPRQFRLGAFSDFAFWNPKNTKWEEIPEAQRPLVSVTRLPFTRDRWTHVAITFESFNREGAEGDAALYLNGVSQGHLRRPQRFTWSPDQVVIMLGINYVGRLDDLAIFSKALSADDVGRLYKLERGVSSLR